MTNDKERLLKVRKQTKRRKPKFLQQDSHKKGKLDKDKWRRPRGMDSKIRLMLKGYRKMPSQGYRSPVAVRFLSKNGLKPVPVANKAGLEGLDPKSDGVLISGTVGKLNKYQIIKLCIEKQLTIINIADPQKFIKRFEEEQAKKKTDKEAKLADKQKKKNALKKAAEKKEKKEKKEEDEQKAEKKDTPPPAEKKDAPAESAEKQQKKEQDKLLIKKGQL